MLNLILIELCKCCVISHFLPFIICQVRVPSPTSSPIIQIIGGMRVNRNFKLEDDASNEEVNPRNKVAVEVHS